jgi:hypothetical protein
MNRLEELEKEIDALDIIIDEKTKAWDKKRFAELDKLTEAEQKNYDHFKSWNEFKAYMKPEWDAIGKLSREKRLTMPYELSELPTYGDVMSLKNFIANVKCGGFINDDGYGNYVKDNKISDVEIYPSDIKNKSVRTDFDTIIWFNR